MLELRLTPERVMREIVRFLDASARQSLTHAGFRTGSRSTVRLAGGRARGGELVRVANRVGHAAWCAPRMGSHRSAQTTRWRSVMVLVSLAVACSGDGDDLVLVGTVERTLVELVAPVSETLIELPAARGRHVRAGEVLARLDPTLTDAEVAGAEARLAGARTAQATAANEFDRATGLRRARVASEQDLERAQLARDEAAARLREAEAALAAARHRLDDLVLRAPVDGVVDQTPFDPGERVPAGGVVCVLLESGIPWVRVWVPERRALAVHLGLPAQVTIDGMGEPLAGRVVDVAREPAFTPHFALTERDRVHLVYETRVSLLDAPPELRPGLPAEVRLVLESFR